MRSALARNLVVLLAAVLAVAQPVVQTKTKTTEYNIKFSDLPNPEILEGQSIGTIIPAGYSGLAWPGINYGDADSGNGTFIVGFTDILTLFQGEVETATITTSYAGSKTQKFSLNKFSWLCSLNDLTAVSGAENCTIQVTGYHGNRKTGQETLNYIATSLETSPVKTTKLGAGFNALTNVTFEILGSPSTSLLTVLSFYDIVVDIVTSS